MGQNNFLGLKHLKLKFFQSKMFFGLKFFRPKIIVPKLYLKLEFDTEAQVLFVVVLEKIQNFPVFLIMMPSLRYVLGISQVYSWYKSGKLHAYLKHIFSKSQAYTKYISHISLE